nr:MAG TPA: hypothetical protein [Caudoviricetes sp.]
MAELNAVWHYLIFKIPIWVCHLLYYTFSLTLLSIPLVFLV